MPQVKTHVFVVVRTSIAYQPRPDNERQILTSETSLVNVFEQDTHVFDDPDDAASWLIEDVLESHPWTSREDLEAEIRLVGHWEDDDDPLNPDGPTTYTHWNINY